MRRNTYLAAYLTIAMGAGALAYPAQAATLADNYYGGSAPGYGDVVGDVNKFNVFSLDVTRVNTSATNADLQVVVHTNYVPGTLNTGFGSLFFGSNSNLGNYNPNKSSANYASDTFKADPDRFNYVFSIPSDPSKANGNGSFYALNGKGTDVQLSYWPTTSDTTDPGVTNFRAGQAVGYKGNDSAVAGTGGTWTFNAAADTLTFLITGENYMLGAEFLIAWAMTCANDVILGKVQVPVGGSGAIGQAPLPAGFLLMGTVLLGAGGVARWRSRRRGRQHSLGL